MLIKLTQINFSGGVIREFLIKFANECENIS